MPTQAEKVQEILKCGRDPVYFMNSYVRVRTVSRGVVPFETWPFQDECVTAFKKHRFNIVLKARQLGLSTLVAAFALWMAIFQKDKSILVIATKLPTAINFIKKVKVMLQNLPPWILIPKLKGESKTQLSFDNGSEITAIPTSEDAGRSEALSLLIVDEAAWIKNFEEIWTGLLPTISTGGRAILLSTPRGVGGQYHKIWVEASAGLNDFNPILLPWNVRPDHDQEWFEKETRGFGKKKIAQEYLCEFLSSGDTYLQAEELEYVHNSIRGPVDKKLVAGAMWVWKLPVPGRKYLVPADVARGDAKDYSAFHVIDPLEGEVVADFKYRLPPDKFADVLNEVGRMYNDALVAPENNTYGHHTCIRLRDVHRYPRLYYKSARGNIYDYRPNDDTELPGFGTSGGQHTASRGQILVKLEEMIRNRTLRVYSQRLYDEFTSFIWKGEKATAAGSANDDLVMSLAIGAWLLEAAFGSAAGQAAVGEALLSAVTTSRRDVSVIPSTNMPILIDPRIALGAQQSRIYRGVRVEPNAGRLLGSIGWLM